MSPKSSPAGGPPLPPGISPRWAWHYRTLLALQARLRNERTEHAAEAAEPLEDPGMHPADVATDEFSHGVALSLLAAEDNALAEVEAAIQRLHRGVYGYCEATGKRIPRARLRALPWCRYTVAAAAVRESTRRGPPPG